MPTLPAFGFGADVDQAGVGVHIGNLDTCKFAIACPGEQRRCQQRAEVWTAGVYQADEFGSREKPRHGFVCILERLHPTPCGVVTYQTIAECAVQDGLEHSQDAVCSGLARALRFAGGGLFLKGGFRG